MNEATDRNRSALYLDHVLIAVNDLESAARTYSRRLGFTLTAEGVHPGRGTHNRLAVFGPEYLELISIKERSRKPFRPSMARFLRRQEGLYMFALGSHDLDRTVSDLRGRGVPVGAPEAGSRGRDDGTVAYTWRSSHVSSDWTPGSEVFIIQHDQTVDERYTEPPAPRRHANGVLGIRSLTLAVHDAESAAARWGQGVGLRRVEAEDAPDRKARRVRLELANCFLDLVSPLGPGPLEDFLESHGQGPYLLALNVRDLEATLADLNGRGTPAGASVAPERAQGASLTLVQAAEGHGPGRHGAGSPG